MQRIWTRFSPVYRVLFFPRQFAAEARAQIVCFLCDFGTGNEWASVLPTAERRTLSAEHWALSTFRQASHWRQHYSQIESNTLAAASTHSPTRSLPLSLLLLFVAGAIVCHLLLLLLCIFLDAFAFVFDFHSASSCWLLAERLSHLVVASCALLCACSS